jgi:hypothetical protein
MAHFAEIDENNIVLRVNVVNNEVITDGDGVEQEQLGIDFLTDLLGGTWKQTSYNTLGGVHSLGGTPFRKNYANTGYTYDATKDAFISPQPYPSWILNETTYRWEPPVAFPFGEAGSSSFEWDEETTNWV